jgi:hypothetical protein
MFPDLAFEALSTARTNVLNDEIVIINGSPGRLLSASRAALPEPR